MLFFFTIALIALFVAVTWFDTPVEPLVRHVPPRENEADDEHADAA